MAFVFIISKRLYVIDFSSLILSLYVVKKGGKRKNTPCNGLPIHGEHDGASCNPVLHCVCKLQSFL